MSAKRIVMIKEHCHPLDGRVGIILGTHDCKDPDDPDCRTIVMVLGTLEQEFFARKNLQTPHDLAMVNVEEMAAAIEMDYLHIAESQKDRAPYAEKLHRAHPYGVPYDYGNPPTTPEGYPIHCKGCEEGVFKCYCGTPDHLKECIEWKKKNLFRTRTGRYTTTDDSPLKASTVVNGGIGYGLFDDLRPEREADPDYAEEVEGGDPAPEWTQKSPSHYGEESIQPVEYIQRNGLDFFEGNVIKYVTRHKHKDGRRDIEKAIHYLEMILANRYS